MRTFPRSGGDEKISIALNHKWVVQWRSISPAGYNVYSTFTTSNPNQASAKQAMLEEPPVNENPPASVNTQSEETTLEVNSLGPHNPPSEELMSGEIPVDFLLAVMQTRGN